MIIGIFVFVDLLFDKTFEQHNFKMFLFACCSRYGFRSSLTATSMLLKQRGVAVEPLAPFFLLTFLD
jgi:hypothetical protein